MPYLADDTVMIEFKDVGPVSALLSHFDVTLDIGTNAFRALPGARVVVGATTVRYLYRRRR